MKKLICTVLIFTFLYTVPVFAEAQNNEKIVTVKIDGKIIEFDEQPRLTDGRTLVPMRKIYEELGAEVEWIGDAQLIVATYKSCIITMKIGKKRLTLADVLTGEVKEMELDVPPQLFGSRTLVPARAVSEALGKKVEWDEEEWTVLISSL